MATILIVDDDPAIVNLLSDVVMEAGHTPISASNGRDALALAQTLRPSLILCDVVMPTMDGLTFVQALRTHRTLATLPVFLMSGRFRPEHFCIDGVTDFLPKPLHLPLIEALLPLDCTLSTGPR